LPIYEIVDVGEAALETDLSDSIFFVGEQLAGEADALAGNIFQRGNAELFLKPFEEDVAAQIGLAAERIHVDAFGKVVMNVLKDEVQTAVVGILGAAIDLVLEMLVLGDADQQLAEGEVGIDIFGVFRAAANPDELVDQVSDGGVIVKMILIDK